MKKKTLNFKEPENITVSIMDEEVLIRPYLTLSEEVALINNYLKTYFFPETKSVENDEWGLWDAEYTLKLAIIDFCTSIKIDEKVAFENLFYSSDFLKIEMSIVNYPEFRALLDIAVKDVKEQIAQKRSIGWAIDSLYEKLGGLLEQISESVKNLTPEMLDKLKETGKELVDKLGSTPLVEKVYEDASKNT